MTKKKKHSGSERDVMRIEYETLCGRVYKLEEDVFRQEELLSEICQAVSYLAQIVLKTEPTRRKRR
jgi:hypothetical protein